MRTHVIPPVLGTPSPRPSQDKENISVRIFSLIISSHFEFPHHGLQPLNNEPVQTSPPVRRTVSAVQAADAEAEEEELQFYVDAAMDLPDDGQKKKKKKGLRASDLNGSRRRILDLAIVYFRFWITTECPYPTDQESSEKAVKYWYQALRKLMNEFGYAGIAAPTEDEISLVSTTSSNIIVVLIFPSDKNARLSS